MWSYSRDVNYYETDRMGVIHHSNYLRILEESRMAWMEENLIPYPEIERQGIIVPFTESRATFISFLNSWSFSFWARAGPAMRRLIIMMK